MGVRVEVASSPNAPSEVLAMLSSYSDGDVCREVAPNPSTDRKTLSKMLSSDSRGHCSALKNPIIPLSAVLEYMISKLEEDEKTAAASSKSIHAMM